MSNSVQALAELREHKAVEQEPLEQKVDWHQELQWAEGAEGCVKAGELASALVDALVVLLALA